MNITKTSMQKICLVLAGLNLAALVVTGHSEHATGINIFLAASLIIGALDK